MRVITGKFGGRKIECPQGYDVRPTSDKIKGSVFNILNNRVDWEDCIVLDVFCGTGSLGIEALSRGAAFCSFIDNNKESLKYTASNLERLKIEGQYEVFGADVNRLRPSFKKHNLVFIDPPYKENLGARTLTGLRENGWFAEDALIILELPIRNDFKLPAGFVVNDEREYGATKVLFLNRGVCTHSDS
jgi:16S rRNA (guanine966-N2)-methyltransferase